MSPPINFPVKYWKIKTILCSLLELADTIIYSILRTPVGEALSCNQLLVLTADAGRVEQADWHATIRKLRLLPL